LVSRSETVEEKLSLVNRFGLTIGYFKPSKIEFENIVITLARRSGITLADDVIIAEAHKWELRHGGISGRTAQQFINSLLGKQI
jgi:predicted AAA+ superfamily ATPase